MISVVWVLSFAISCPLLFGLNNTGMRELYTPAPLPFHSVTTVMEEVWFDTIRYSWYRRFLKGYLLYCINACLDLH